MINNGIHSSLYQTSAYGSQWIQANTNYIHKWRIKNVGNTNVGIDVALNQHHLGIKRDFDCIYLF